MKDSVTQQAKAITGLGIYDVAKQCDWSARTLYKYAADRPKRFEVILRGVAAKLGSWQPIDTAPFDKPFDILVKTKRGGIVHLEAEFEGGGFEEGELFRGVFDQVYLDKDAVIKYYVEWMGVPK